MTAGYDDSAAYKLIYTSFAMARQACIVLIPAIVSDAVQQVVFAQMAMLCFAAAAAFINPFSAPNMNRLEVLGIVVCMINQLLGLAYASITGTVGDQGGSSGFQATPLSLTITGIAVILLVAFFGLAIRMYVVRFARTLFRKDE